MNACSETHNIESKVSKRDKKSIRIQITHQTDLENEGIIQTSHNTPQSSLKRQTDILNYVKNVQVSKFNQISHDHDELWLTDINTQEYLYKLPEVRPFFEGRTQLKLIQQSNKNKGRITKILQHLKDSSFSIHSNYQCALTSKPLRQNSVHFDFSNADQSNLNESLQTEQMAFSPFHKRRRTTTPKQKKAYDPLNLQIQIHNFAKIKRTNKQIISEKQIEAKEIVQKSELFRKETLQEKRNLINYQQFKNTQREQYSLRSQLNQSLHERLNKSHQQREGFIRLLERLQKQTYLNIDKMIIDQLDRIRQLLMIGKPIKGDNIFLNKSLKITKMIMQQLKIG